jgi:PTH1 family peptidyl-tRNA hydrolase
MGDESFKGLIVGLGNPGLQYSHTPHNFGFLALEAFLESPRGRWIRTSCPAPQCELWRGDLDGQKWLAAKPLTYMNLSGMAIGPLAKWYKLEPDQILVIQDELDLPLGVLRFKQGGGTGGHKGIASVAAALGSASFFRLRIGIGRPLPGVDPGAYVLRRFSEDNQEIISNILSEAVTALIDFCLQGSEKAMQTLHSRR